MSDIEYDNNTGTGNLFGFNRLCNAALRSEGFSANKKKIKDEKCIRHTRD